MDRFKEIVEARGLSYYQVAKDLNLTEGAVRAWKKGGHPGRKNLNRLASYLGVSPSYLLYGEEVHPQFLKERPVPLLGRVPAGFPEQIPSEEIVDYINLPLSPKDSYALLVKGESMAPTIRDGDYILFIPRNDIKSGDILVVLNEWGEALLKRYRMKEGKPILISDNPDYPPVEPNKHYKIVGKVVKVWREIKL